MNDNDLKVKLERIITDLSKVEGVEGSLIIDDNSEVLAQRIMQDADISLFGPMAHVIISSSKLLLNSSNQGEINRILIESKNGKALFLHPKNVHFIVLMKNRANVGLIMVSSNRAAAKILKLTKDLKTLKPKKSVKNVVSSTISQESVAQLDNLVEKPEPKELDNILIKTAKDKKVALQTEVVDPSVGIAPELESEIKAEPQEKSDVILEPKSETIEDINVALVDVEENADNEIFDEKPKIEPVTTIPVIKPPIAFPDLEKVVDIPEDFDERSDLILNIYEAIFRAMSIGASKIMGVAPARGLTQKFLPSEDCHEILDGVNVRSNSTIDFNKIRENVNNIPLDERESKIIEDLSRVIDVVTFNYGKVMGYAAFRGMVRPEFNIISGSYGQVMDKLGITNKINPELTELFNDHA